MAHAFESGKLFKLDLKGKTCRKWANRQNIYIREKKMSPGGCLPLPRGYIQVHVHNIQTSSALKPLGHQSQTLCGASLGGGNESLYKLSRSHDPDGHHGYK